MASGVFHSFAETLFTQRNSLNVSTDHKGLNFMTGPATLSSDTTTFSVGMSPTQVGVSTGGGNFWDLQVSAMTDAPITTGASIEGVVLTLNPLPSLGVSQAPGNYVGIPMIAWENLVGMPYTVTVAETYVIWYQNYVWSVIA